MKTLHERLVDAFNVLVDNRVFLLKYNRDPYCKCPFEHLQFTTNNLSVRDFKIMLSVCELYSLEFAVNYAPSSINNNLCVIFHDFNHG